MPISKASSNAVAPAAKGDLVVGTTTNDSGILGVGSNGDTLVADSAASTGLRWQGNYAAGKNSILNADFGIWQRGTSIANSSAAANYTADRWFIYSGTANKTVSRQTTSDTTNLPFIQYCARVQRNSGNTALDSIIYAQSLETSASIPFVGRTVTLSFYARKGANFSSSSDILNMALNTGTGTDQNNVTSYTGFATPLSQNVTLTSTWQRFSASVSIATTVTEIGLRFTYTPTGTAGANDYFEITGVQLEQGSVATAFETATGTLQGELAACKRYYQVFTTGGNAAFVGQAYGTAAAFCTPSFQVEMRVAPTITLAAAGSGAGQMSFLNSAGGIPGTIGTFSADFISKFVFRLVGQNFTSAFVAGNAAALWGDSADVYRASAEL